VRTFEGDDRLTADSRGERNHMQIDLSLPLPLEAIAVDAQAVDAEGRFPRVAIDELARAGLLGVGLPQSHGPFVHRGVQRLRGFPF
jgi:alkylation response protein AidB-like acyl-CoA dehydrogenase